MPVPMMIHGARKPGRDKVSEQLDPGFDGIPGGRASTYRGYQLVSLVTKLPPQMACESQVEKALANCCMSFSPTFPMGVTK